MLLKGHFLFFLINFLKIGVEGPLNDRSCFGEGLVVVGSFLKTLDLSLVVGETELAGRIGCILKSQVLFGTGRAAL